MTSMLACSPWDTHQCITSTFGTLAWAQASAGNAIAKAKAKAMPQAATLPARIRGYSARAGTSTSRWPLAVRALTRPAFSISSSKRAERL